MKIIAHPAQAAVDGDEQFFDTWLRTMKENGLSMVTIKSKIEELDHDQYSALHYAVRYNHIELAGKLMEEFHCGTSNRVPLIGVVSVSLSDANLVGHHGETPLHTAARYQFLDLSRGVATMVRLS